MVSTYLDLRAITRCEAARSGDDRQAHHRLLQRLALARCAIIGISIPPIPWPMTGLKKGSSRAYIWKNANEVDDPPHTKMYGWKEPTDIHTLVRFKLASPVTAQKGCFSGHPGGGI